MSAPKNEPYRTMSLEDVPLELALDGLPADPHAWLDLIPTSFGDDLLVDYPASDPSGASEVVSCRVPLSWIDMIDTIRQKPGTQSPDLWPKRGNFVRWALFCGITELRRIQIRIDSGTERLDPMLQARIFIEKQGGHAVARAQIMNDAVARTNDIGDAVTMLMSLDEYAEAADFINDWIAGATQNDSPFWKTFFCRSLLKNPQIAAAVQLLVMERYIVDEYFVSMAVADKVVAMLPADDEPQSEE